MKHIILCMYIYIAVERNEASMHSCISLERNEGYNFLYIYIYIYIYICWEKRSI